MLWKLVFFVFVERNINVKLCLFALFGKLLIFGLQLLYGLACLSQEIRKGCACNDEQKHKYKDYHGDGCADLGQKLDKGPTENYRRNAAALELNTRFEKHLEGVCKARLRDVDRGEGLCQCAKQQDQNHTADRPEQR